MADTATTLVAPLARAKRMIFIKEPTPTKPTPKKVPKGKGKKKLLLLLHKMPLPHL